MWLKSDKAQIKNLLLKHKIVQKPIQNPTKKRICRTTNAITENLRRTNFLKRKMKKIYKFANSRTNAVVQRGMHYSITNLEVGS